MKTSGRFIIAFVCLTLTNFGSLAECRFLETDFCDIDSSRLTKAFCQFPNNDTYEGQLDCYNKYSGYGTYTFSNGDYYRGSYRNGVPHGKGEEKLGQWYYLGNFHLGKRTGQGKEISPDQIIKSGEFRNGIPEGKVEISYPEGVIEQTWFKNGVANGITKMTEVATGKSITGNKVDGLAEGEWVTTEPNGDRYYQRFVGGMLQPTSRWKFKRGGIYQQIVDDDGNQLEAFWLEEPKNIWTDQVRILFVTQKDVGTAKQAKVLLQKGKSLRTVADDLKVRERDVVMLSTQSDLVSSQHEKNINTIMKLDIGSVFGPMRWDNVQTGMTAWDVGLVIEKKEVSSPKLPREKKYTAPKNQKKIQQPKGTGTGFFVSAEGHILTNNHVVDGCSSLSLISSNAENTLSIVGTDKTNDLAILKSTISKKNSLKFAKRPIKLTEEIFVAGFPFGEAISTSIKVTKGIVSSLAGMNNNYATFQIDAAVQTGNSGGPVVNENGSVIGVVVAKLNPEVAKQVFGVASENVNFAIKGQIAKLFMDAHSIPYETSDRSLSNTSESLEKNVVHIGCF